MFHRAASDDVRQGGTIEAGRGGGGVGMGGMSGWVIVVDEEEGAIKSSYLFHFVGEVCI